MAHGFNGNSFGSQLQGLADLVASQALDYNERGGNETELVDSVLNTPTVDCIALLVENPWLGDVEPPTAQRGATVNEALRDVVVHVLERVAFTVTQA